MTNFFLHANRRPNLLNHDTGDFYQIRHYGKEDVSVMSAVVMKALTVIAETNRSAIKTTCGFSLLIS
ncbi:hypothetical protein [Priestia megaterium]|uniref:hypothetical protein n=1 Tax=Priestia megaterium TaxID=1404 RepID=UPI003012FB01